MLAEFGECQDIGLGTAPMRLEGITSSMTSEECLMQERLVVISGCSLLSVSLYFSVCFKVS